MRHPLTASTRLISLYIKQKVCLFVLHKIHSIEPISNKFGMIAEDPPQIISDTWKCVWDQAHANFIPLLVCKKCAGSWQQWDHCYNSGENPTTFSCCYNSWKPTASSVPTRFIINLYFLHVCIKPRQNFNFTFFFCSALKTELTNVTNILLWINYPFKKYGSHY